MVNLEKALTTMEDTALEAGRKLLQMQPRSQRLDAPKDFLTDADLRAERIILSRLESEYPEIPSLSEEKGGEELTEGYLWIVDPIDGTINFFFQDEHWGDSIGLAYNGRTIAGVVYLPGKGQLFSASTDIPARVRRIGKNDALWEDIHVNQKNLEESQVWTGWGKEEHGGKDHERFLEILARLNRITLYPQIRNSATADMMMVAQGKIAGYVFPKPDPFDIAAAAFIIERAGGNVTDMEGSLWTPFSKGIVVSNGSGNNHKELLRIVQE